MDNTIPLEKATTSEYKLYGWAVGHAYDSHTLDIDEDLKFINVRDEAGETIAFIHIEGLYRGIEEHRKFLRESEE